jgi:phenylpropionate dioxygenase-like ring-hydroxylating dioxygenase large terminal subunit
MSKDRQGKLKMGPIWDFNLGFGNDDRPAFFNSANWVFNFNNYYPNDTWLIHFWWKKLLSDPSFTSKLKARWVQLRGTTLSSNNINKTIEQHINILKNNNSINPHFERWKILGVKLPFNNFVGKTHQEELDYLKSWITKRLNWIDAEIVKL